MKSFNIDSYIYVIDSKNTNEIEKLSNSINKKDIIFEMYNKNLLTF